jgi:5-formyltetrahydrofolate cyclo-ligase
VPTEKTNMRRALRNRRNQLTLEEQRLAARKLAAKVVGMRLYRASQRIACYQPIDGEIDTSYIIEHIHQMRKICYLPVISRLSHDRLWFAKNEVGVEFVRNRYGVLEPDVKSRDLVRARELDLILMPLVGFDDHGNRLGMGLGFYDHTLAFLRLRNTWRKPYIIGLAYDFQRANGIEAGPWDVPLQSVVTDQAVYIY